MTPSLRWRAPPLANPESSPSPEPAPSLSGAMRRDARRAPAAGATSSATRAVDSTSRARPCAPLRALLDATGSEDANGALHRFYAPDWPRSRVATLAPLVDEAAMAGDPVARDILHNAAQQLAVLTSSVRQQLWKPGEPARVAWTGGVFRSRMLLER